MAKPALRKPVEIIDLPTVRVDALARIRANPALISLLETAAQAA